MEKISENNINNCDFNIFGDWINDDFKCNNYPFKHCIIKNFLKEDIYNLISDEFPEKPDENWWKYENPLEVKFTNDKINTYGFNIKNLFYSLSHHKIIDKLKNVFEIDNLEYDPYCHGGGLHIMPKHGRLNLHLDYEKHPISNKQRRLNIIFYLNNDWKEEWNGATELWEKNMENCIIKSFPKPNSAILFVTDEISWHGITQKILCPENIFRKTIAFYYVSNLINKSSINKYGSNKEGFREKAIFVKNPNDKFDERLEKLFKIRPFRLITKEDMNEIYPTWTIYE